MPVKRWLPTWCQSVSDLFAYQFRRFAGGAWVVLVIAIVIVIYRQETASHRQEHVIRDLRALARENAARIEDIQKSRVESCQRTYNSFPEVFKPFIPPVQTPQQLKDWQNFLALVHAKAHQCVLQTRGGQH